jgi:phosphonate transport system substrate-binding protein
MNRLATRLALLAAIIFLTFTPQAQAAQPKLVIGLIPEMNVFKQMERFKPLAGYLSKQIGIEVEVTILSRYGNILDSFVTQKMDGAFFGSFTGALAIEKLGVIPLARPVNLNGESTYRGLIYTRKDSGIKTIADFKGKKFAFVEKATTAGYLFPLAYFRKNGVADPARFLGEAFFAGSHDASLDAVLNQKADVGASKNTVFHWVRSTNPRIDQEIVILAESFAVPSNGLCVRPDLDPLIQQKLKNALLALNQNPEGQPVLEKLKALKFIDTTVADFQPVIEMATQAGIELKNYQYRNE